LNHHPFFSEDQKNRTPQAIAGALSDRGKISKCGNLATSSRLIWMDYGQRVAKALNIHIDPAMLQQNQQNNPQPVTA